MNITFTYLCRDAANDKQYNEVVLQSKPTTSSKNTRRGYRNLIHENWLIAKDWNLPGMHFKDFLHARFLTERFIF